METCDSYTDKLVTIFQMFGSATAKNVPEIEAPKLENNELSINEIQSQKRLSAFAEHDLTIKIENIKLHVNKDQLMAESSVFERMFTSDFKEKQEKEIELKGKDLNSSSLIF